MAELAADTGFNSEVEVKRLSELRVIDLRAELKKRNLDIGGNKSALMERLRKAIEEEGGNPDEIQISSDTPSKKTPKRSGRVRKQEEEAEDNGLEEDSGDSQENEETSLEQENEKVLEILGESDKSEQLKEESPGVEDSVDQDDSCVKFQKTNEEEDVFVTIESADNALDLDGETNKDCEAEGNDLLGPDDGTILEQNARKGMDLEIVAIDSTGGQVSEIQPNVEKSVECEMKTESEEEDKDGEKVLKDENTEEASTKVTSAKEDDQRMSLTEEADRNVKTDEKGQTGSSSGKNLWVSGLSSTTRATDLKNLFSKYGKVVGAKVVTNARSPGARCYGFVTMSSSEDATKCINHLHRTELHGRMISVEKAKNEPAGKKPSEKKESEPKKSSSSDQRHLTDKHEKSSPSLKDDTSNKEVDKTVDKEKAKEENRSDRSRTSKSGSRGTERTVVMDKSKGEPVISVKTSSDSKERSSKSQDRKSGSKEKKEILSFEKIKEQRERERQRQREREIREMERQRERDRRVRERLLVMREREERERLRRERVRLQFERERLDRERMERERLERERMRIEEERRIEQERIQREREELRRQQDRLRYEQDRRGIRRPYDMDGRRDEPYWPDSKRMALDDRYRDFGRPDRFHDFENRDRGRYMDHMDRRDDSRVGMGGRDMNYSDRHGRDQRDGWGDYVRRVDDGRSAPPPGRDGRNWGDHGRKMDSERSRPGDRGLPGASGQGHLNREGVHGFLPNDNSQSMSAIGIQGGNFGGQNRPNEPRYTHRY